MPGFTSENDPIMEVVSTVRQVAKTRGIYVIDRGGDRPDIFRMFLDHGVRFIIRRVGNRALLWRNRPLLAEKLAAKCRMLYADTLRRETENGAVYRIQCGAMRVRLPGRDQSLGLVVVRGLAEKPMMLLTNVAATESRASLWQVVEGYLSRWRVEDAIRFMKQSYRLEDIRRLDYRRLKNMMAIVLAAVYVAAAWPGKSLRHDILVRNITRVSQRLFGVVEFHDYALVDGIATLLRRYGAWHRRVPSPSPDALQLEIPLFESG